ncbi:hypothetical protein FDP41_011402 [Naegleria fowleri]|uniref:F-box domain-containing protein n=1 Tax=Naegleria fowleri TaxID=5763 RepID=A0A6A5C6K1_NAEFO|nr:uncharacterized protein FDP41_011402 [Naegleria fowleri]KAF0982472.1 hypothetical protein FDP41_011402 [Naegleria fowleri]
MGQQVIPSSSSTTKNNSFKKIHDQTIDEFLSEHTAVRYFEEHKTVLNMKNQSVLEQELPTELIFEILTYLPPIELWKLSCVSHNFRFYWTEYPLLWCSTHEKKCLVSEILKQNKQLLKKENSSRFYWRNIYFEILESYLSTPKCFIEFCEQCKIGRIYGEFNRVIKIGFIGPQECGKTVFTQCIGNLDYILPTRYIPTIGAEYVCQYLNYIPPREDPFCMKLDVWDIAGDEKFSFLRQTYSRGLNSVFFCFDIASMASFKKMTSHLEEFFETRIGSIIGRDSPPEIHRKFCESYYESIGILGMKCDLERGVTRENIMQLMSKISDLSVPYLQRKVAYFEVSSKSKGNSFFFPLMYACHSLIMTASSYPHKLTLLTDENMEQFSDYGFLD